MRNINLLQGSSTLRALELNNSLAKEPLSTLDATKRVMCILNAKYANALGMDYDGYNKAILKAGELTMTHTKQKCAGWFQLSRATLAPLLSIRNQLLHAVKHASHLSLSIQSTMWASPRTVARYAAAPSPWAPK
jgi:hypothetical protein